MAAPYNPPVKAEDFIMYVALPDKANPGHFKANPTIAAGDFKISKDGGALANMATLPTNEPAGSIWLKCSFSTTETNCDVMQFQAIDQTAPAEWCDVAVPIIMSA